MGVIRTRGLIDLCAHATRQPGENQSWRRGRTFIWGLASSVMPENITPWVWVIAGYPGSLNQPEKLWRREKQTNAICIPICLQKDLRAQSDDKINDGVWLLWSTSSIQTALMDLRLRLTLELKRHYEHCQCLCLCIMYGWVTLISIFFTCFREMNRERYCLQFPGGWNQNKEQRDTLMPSLCESASLQHLE